MATAGQYKTAKGWATQPIIVACAGCGTSVRIFRVQEIQRDRHFCSRACYHADRRQRLNPNISRDKKPRACQGCGNNFIPKRMVSEKNPANYCSKGCHYASMNVSPEQRRATSLASTRRRETKLRAAQALNGHHTEQEWQDCLTRHGHKCAHCPATARLTRDHIIPLSKGGSDLIENIQPLCHPCNCRKGNRL